MTRYKLSFSYVGKFFFGFQIQDKKRTVQGELLKALQKISSDIDSITSCGRTDRGVHSLCHVIHFDSDFIFDKRRIVRTLNSLLPNDISVLEITFVSDDFDARRSAISREYRYLFSNQDIPDKYSEFILFLPYFFDFGYSELFSQFLIGEHDFSRFRKKGSMEKSTVRTIYDCSFIAHSSSSLFGQGALTNVLYEFRIVGNAFLYQMVRNLMGAWVQLMCLNYSFNEFREFFLYGKGSFNYSPVPATGLCLVGVNY